MNNALVKYTVGTGAEVALSPEIVRKYITTNPQVTDGEVAMFIELCKYQKLNPFTREAFLIKYKDTPAQTVVAAVAMNQRAKANPNYAGEKSGITFERDGKMERRKGIILRKGETLVGAWCEVYVKGYQEPIFVEVPFDAFNRGQAQWLTMPTVMIHKVACATAWRTAFPNDFAGMYSAEEMPVDVSSLPTNAIDITNAPEAPTQTQDNHVYITDAEYKAFLNAVRGDDQLQQQAVAMLEQLGVQKTHRAYKGLYRAMNHRQYGEVMAFVSDHGKAQEPEVEPMQEDAPDKVIDITPMLEPDPMPEPEQDYDPEPVYAYEQELPEPPSTVTQAPDTNTPPYADFVPYKGRHKYAGKTLAKLPRWVLEQEASRMIENDRWYDSNKATQDKIRAYLGEAGNIPAEPEDDYPLPFDLD